MNKDDNAIWLYGSYARGDHDYLSDIDLFVAGKLDIGEIRNLFNFDPARISISQYEWQEIEVMARYGSLFLQHL